MPLILPHRYIVLVSALLSLVGACVIIFSALRFRELSKRFFAIRLIFFLAVTDCFAALFNILGAFVDVDALLRPSGKVPFLCVLQAVGVLYFNLASILWTSCFAFVSASQPTARRPAPNPWPWRSLAPNTRHWDCRVHGSSPARGSGVIGE